MRFVFGRFLGRAGRYGSARKRKVLMEAIFHTQRQARWLYLLISLAVLLCLGLIYAWSIFRIPLENEFGWTKAETSITFSISMMMFCIGGVVSGFLTQRRGVRTTMVLCAITLAAGFMGASAIHSLWGIYLTYGGLAGLGAGLGYNAVISTIVKWFPDKQGLVSGISLMGFGFGAMILGTAGAGLLTIIGWRMTFLLIGIAFGILMLLGAILLRPVPIDFLQQMKGSLKGCSVFLEEVDFRQMLRRKNFWLYVCWAAALGAGGLAIINISASYASGFLGGDLKEAAAVAGIVSVANGVGRVAFGQLFDSKGYKITMRSVSITFLFAGLALLSAEYTGQLLILGIGYTLIGLSYGGVTPTNAAYTAYFFGQKHYALNFSITNLNLIVASYIGPICASGAPLTAFLIMIGLAVLGISLSFVIKTHS